MVVVVVVVVVDAAAAVVLLVTSRLTVIRSDKVYKLLIFVCRSRQESIKFFTISLTSRARLSFPSSTFFLSPSLSVTLYLVSDLLWLVFQ